MTWWVIALSALVLLLTSCTTAPTCTWVAGPFYLEAALGPDEPEHYAPTGLLHLQHCLQTGALRVPSSVRACDQPNLGDCHIHPAKED